MPVGVRGYRIIYDVLRPCIRALIISRCTARKAHRRFVNQKAREDQTHRGTRAAGSRSSLQPDFRSMDFVSEAICLLGSIAKRIKCLMVADDFAHECVDIPADFGIDGHYVNRLLDRAVTFLGYPTATRTDIEPEFTCRAFMT